MENLIFKTYNMEAYSLSALVTIFTSLLIFYLAYNVGDTRRKNKSSVLDTKQPKEVVIASRVHLNTIEVAVVFIPLLWVATVFASDLLAGVIGVVWFVSRVWYAVAYLDDPSKRTIPFMIGLPCLALISILALYGIVF